MEKKAKAKAKKNAEGLVDIEGELSFDDAKMKITLYLDLKVLDAAKAAADAAGMKYQTYINLLLRRKLLDEKDPLEQRIVAVEEDIREIKRRIS